MNSHTLDATLQGHVLRSTGASLITEVDHVQTLWSGFGQIMRLRLDYAGHRQNGDVESVIIKQVQPPEHSNHPRGWNSDTSTQRKLESYRVETHWYRHYAESCNTVCAVPELLDSHSVGNHTWLILEDLDPRFPLRRSELTIKACFPCLRWLARFHAHHFQQAGSGLWPNGSYWHLQTRLDEYAAMPDGLLKDKAVAIDAALYQCPFQTLVHGDAKVANFCFSETGDAVAMIDFQYVGRGCGIRDVAYFMGSCLSAADCHQHADALLDVYFTTLIQHLPANAKQPVEENWRNLYAIAWADFNRFLAGWMPDHHKINSYMHSMTERALTQL